MSAGLLLLLLLAPEPAEVQRTADAILSDPAYQTEFPFERRTGAAEVAEWDAPDGPPWADGPSLRGTGSGLGLLFQALFWIVIGLGLLVLVLWLASELSQRRARRARAPGGAAAPAPVPAAGRAVPPHERLAAEGRFAEAIHALLLAVFARLKTPLARSWTSREVVRQVELAEAPRRALGELVRAVEVTHFGGGEADEARYRACLARAREVVGG